MGVVREQLVKKNVLLTLSNLSSLRLMQNQSDVRVSRTFINFFVVDPNVAQSAIGMQHHFTGAACA
jgi:hypothetical protein